jgi:hypothetical protein
LILPKRALGIGLGAANAKAFCVHLDIIEMHKETHEELEFANDFMKDHGSTFIGTSGLAANDDDEEDAAKVVSYFEISSSLFESILPLNANADLIPVFTHSL